MRFQIPTDTPLRPFVIAASPAALRLPKEVRVVDPLDPRNASFCDAMNRANCLAYDGTTTVGTNAGALGMPKWVMLDCCMLPSGIFGFEIPRELVPAELADQLNPAGDSDWLGVSEYIALPSIAPGEVVGVSLFSFVSGLSLGRRSKALALAAHQATTQRGVTQWTSPGVPLHSAFGRMCIAATGVPVHNRAHETFVYSVQLRSRDRLLELYRGAAPAESSTEVVGLSVDPRVTDVPGTLATHAGRPVVVGTGPVVDGAVSRLDFAFDE